MSEGSHIINTVVPMYFLLVRAAEEGHISREEANQLHDEMRALGFWDTGQPVG